MTAVSNNPLRKYFREPGPSFRLPSGGYFYPQGLVETGISGEVEVYPMTAYDELVLKNPDGLLSGDSVIKVVASCAPGIADPRHLCMADVTAIMLAVRGASYGDELTVETQCTNPECKHQNSFAMSIQYLLATPVFMEPEYVVAFDDGVKVRMRPHSYAVATRAAINTFEQIKTIQALGQQELSEDQKNAAFEDAFNKMCGNNLGLLAEGIEAVVIPEGPVTDRMHILEWVHNIDRNKADRLQQMQSEIQKAGIRRTVPAQCQKCGHEWEARLTFDPSHFFG